MKLPDKKLIDQAWDLAAHVEWTVEDWKDFYETITLFFIRVVGRHARAKINCPAESRVKPRSEITGQPQAIRPDSAG